MTAICKSYLPPAALPPDAERKSGIVLKCFNCGKEKPMPYGCTKKAYAYKMSIKGRIKYFCSHTCMEEARAKYRPGKQKEK